MNSPWLDSREAAEYLRFMKNDEPDLESLRRFLKRHQVQMVKRGRRLLIHKDDLLAVLTPLGPQRRNA